MGTSGAGCLSPHPYQVAWLVTQEKHKVGSRAGGSSDPMTGSKWRAKIEAPVDGVQLECQTSVGPDLQRREFSLATDSAAAMP
jgi:hypothetical protein